jgi:hypothetical protein
MELSCGTVQRPRDQGTRKWCAIAKHPAFTLLIVMTFHKAVARHCPVDLVLSIRPAPTATWCYTEVCASCRGDGFENIEHSHTPQPFSSQ